jgi:type II secretory pathway component GspD/PulD (secretin)
LYLIPKEKKPEVAVQVEGKQAVSVEARFLLVDGAFLNEICSTEHAKEIIGTQGDLDWRQFPVKLIEPSATSHSTDLNMRKVIVFGLNGFNIDDQQADFIIRATRAYASSKVLTAPKVLVFDNESASISVVRQRSYIFGYTRSEGSQEPEPIIDKIDTGILFRIQPKIQPNGKYIDLSINIEISTEVDTKKAMYQEKYPYEIPIIEKTYINTGFIVPDRGTVLLEGPMVTDKNDDNTTSKKKLLILIKPTIAKPKSG